MRRVLDFLVTGGLLLAVGMVLLVSVVTIAVTIPLWFPAFMLAPSEPMPGYYRAQMS